VCVTMVGVVWDTLGSFCCLDARVSQPEGVTCHITNTCSLWGGVRLELGVVVCFCSRVRARIH
jgi:hypothetical protein